MAEVRGSRTHRTPVPRRPTGFEGQESHRTLLTSGKVIIKNNGYKVRDTQEKTR